VYHIPVCPFSQRLEILLSLKGCSDFVNFHIVDITRPRPQWLLEKSRGTTALPILETSDVIVLKESQVILQYLEDTAPGRDIAQTDPLRRAIENMLVTLSGPLADAGYSMILNQDLSQRSAHEKTLLGVYRAINDFLEQYALPGGYLFEEFGWAEVVFAPLFMRFWFLEYYEGFKLPQAADFARVSRWQAMCREHPHAQQVTQEEIVKLYFDYAKGAGNGSLVAGRSRSSFAFDPHWKSRPWPPKDKYTENPGDAELGLG
jgi:glutathione S-transferase